MNNYTKLVSKADLWEPENLRASPEQLERLKEAPPKRVTPKALVEHAQKLRDRKAKVFVQSRYTQLLNIAQVSRDAVLATVAELLYLRYKKWDKPIKGPVTVELSNYIFRQLGFNHHAKHRALSYLETAGAIRVEWRQRRCPLVTILDL